MSAQQRPEAPGRVPGASSWARRFNQDTVEWLAAWCRVFSLTWSLATAGALFGLIWWPSWSWAGTLVTCIGLLALHAWLGFFKLANPEWKEEDHG